MEITDEMINAVRAFVPAPCSREQARKAVQAVLSGLPDVEPFTFTGHEGLRVYIHQCGTVIDVSPADPATAEQVAAGECDCENTSPWRRIYVEKEPA